ncbi:MAG: tRNA (adenosine(37)-N6)-threonylcarbamoyltransferase complex ATPase subunit type 1 TsaE [Rhodospirillales bacterium]|nr:tRNA (adenosine(37)-N6)-threonylcarbamoyltransferase complex ATPase subunit type 1 TsaE [Rhodospirillales bacterium]
MVKPIVAASPILLELSDLEATRALAGRIALWVRPGDVLALSGALGAGKTAFARAFIEAFAKRAGAPTPEEIPSPTFTLVQVYEFEDCEIYHFDLYRVDTPAEAHELGIEDAFADSVSLIEWPDRLGALLPGDRLEIELRDGATEHARQAEITGIGVWSDRVTEIFPND